MILHACSKLTDSFNLSQVPRWARKYLRNLGSTITQSYRDEVEWFGGIGPGLQNDCSVGHCGYSIQ